MKSRPMTFTGEEVRAMLHDPPLKTQTRRILKPQPNEKHENYLEHNDVIFNVVANIPKGEKRFAKVKESRGRNLRAFRG